MTQITVEGNKLNPDIYLELFDFDASLLIDKQGDPGTINYFSNTPTNGTTPILWRGNSYFHLPFALEGIQAKGDGTSPARPTITISEVNQFLLAALLSLGNLTGMRVKRWRTFYKFTDQGASPNPLMHYPIEEWVVTKKVSQDKETVKLELTNALDRPGLRLPRKQILKDFGFPGVGRIRSR